MSEASKLESAFKHINNMKVRIEELKKENEKLKMENDLLKYNAVNIPANMSDEEAAAIIAQLKNERMQLIPGEPLPIEKLIELAERKKEAEIYKELYQRLFKRFVD